MSCICISSPLPFHVFQREEIPHEWGELKWVLWGRNTSSETTLFHVECVNFDESKCVVRTLLDKRAGRSGFYINVGWAKMKWILCAKQYDYIWMWVPCLEPDLKLKTHAIKFYQNWLEICWRWLNITGSSLCRVVCLKLHVGPTSKVGS